jgi:hypothetical protein
MPKSYKKLQELLTFDNLMTHLDEQFDKILDHRRANTTYCLPDVLKSAFSMFSLKSPSLLSFQEQTRIERRNLKRIYRIGKIPADTQMRTVLDQIEPENVRRIFPSLFGLLSEAGVIKEYEYVKKHLVISVDGVEHFSSKKIHCANCTTKKRRDGTVSYSHAALAAVIVHPEQKEVVPLDFEPIVCQDGVEKNDCERVAAKRLCKSLKQKYGDEKLLLVEDALSANAPHIRQIGENGWDYIINVKPDSHKSLFKQFEWRRANGEVKSIETVDEKGVRRRYSWTNGLFLNQSAADVKVNCLWYEEEDAGGKVTRWSWITSIRLERRTVGKIMKAGRARWKIENETFNTLKNQGYHFEHNYGHGQKHLASVLAMLMMTAFLVDQIQERCCKLFKQLRAGLRTRKKLWETMRSLFKVVALGSMSLLYKRMAGLYEIQLN